MDHPTTKMAEVEERPEDRPRDWRTATEILGDSRDLYERKNADYGDSWTLAGKTMAMWFQHQGMDEVRIPTNEFHMTSFQLFTRRLDKMIRTFNGWFIMDEGDEFQVDESIVETHQDEVPYAAMHTQLAEQYAYADAEEIL
jgi:hypothetical protein